MTYNTPLGERINSGWHCVICIAESGIVIMKAYKLYAGILTETLKFVFFHAIAVLFQLHHSSPTVVSFIRRSDTSDLICLPVLCSNALISRPLPFR